MAPNALEVRLSITLGSKTFDIGLQQPVDLVDDVLPGFGDELVPILSLVIGYIDEGEPVFTACRRIGRSMFAGNIDVNGRVVVNGFLCEKGIEFFPVIGAEQDIVQFQFREFFFDAPVKDDTGTGFGL